MTTTKPPKKDVKPAPKKETQTKKPVKEKVEYTETNLRKGLEELNRINVRRTTIHAGGFIWQLKRIK